VKAKSVLSFKKRPAGRSKRDRVGTLYGLVQGAEMRLLFHGMSKSYHPSATPRLLLCSGGVR
jgi:hypothetical protein